MKQSCRRGHAHQAGDFGAAARLPIDHHGAWIAAEIGDVVADPAQRSDQVGHPYIGGIGIVRAADLGHVEEAQRVETVIDGHLHNIVVPRQLRAFMRGQLIGRAEAEATTMKIDHHRPLAAEAGGPDVQLEHVLAHITVVPIEQERGLDPLIVMQSLRTVSAIDQSRIFVVPGLRRLGRQPAAGAAGVLAVRHALESEDAAIEKAAHPAILSVGHRRARRGAISRLLVHSGLGAVERVGRPGQHGSHARRRGKKQRLAAIECDSVFRT